MTRWMVGVLVVACVGCGSGHRTTPPPPEPPPATWTLTLRTAPEGVVEIVDGPNQGVGGVVGPEGVLVLPGLEQSGFTVCVDGEAVWQRECAGVTLVADVTVDLPWESPVPPRMAGNALLRLRANFCNLNDGWGNGQRSVIYTSTMPTVWAVDRARAERWIEVQVAAGSTHVAVNVPSGGPSYAGIWEQPDFWGNLERYGDFLEWLLAQRGAGGKGLVPVIFMDDGSRDPLPRIRARWPRFGEMLRRRGLIGSVVGVIAFEPVVGDWSSYEVSEALKLADRTFGREFALAYHGSPERLVGSSNPVAGDDPWRGGEAAFYKEHGGEAIDVALYQTPHGRRLYEECDVEDDGCWLNRWRDYVVRIGGGRNGWRVLPITLFETVAYEYIRGQATSAQAREIAQRGAGVCRAAGVECGMGNGLPGGY